MQFSKNGKQNLSVQSRQAIERKGFYGVQGEITAYTVIAAMAVAVVIAALAALILDDGMATCLMQASHDTCAASIW